MRGGFPSPSKDSIDLWSTEMPFHSESVPRISYYFTFQITSGELVGAPKVRKADEVCSDVGDVEEASFVGRNNSGGQRNGRSLGNSLERRGDSCPGFGV